MEDKTKSIPNMGYKKEGFSSQMLQFHKEN